MYVRPDGGRKPPKDLSIPRNYSGNAFIPKAQHAEGLEEEISTDALPTEVTKSEAVETLSPIREEKKGFLSGLLENDDFLLLGLILLLSQDGLDDDILPILLLILFLKK